MKRFKIQVFRQGETGADDEHIVRIEITEGDREIGVFCLAGGTLQIATGIAEDLKSLVAGGFDLTQLMPDEGVLETQ